MACPFFFGREPMEDIECYLNYPQQTGPFTAVYLASIERGEWLSFALWVSDRRAALPMLANLLAAELPVIVDRPQVLRLREECRQVDWDTLSGSALGCLASLSLFLDQAANQENAGARFEEKR